MSEHPIYRVISRREYLGIACAAAGLSLLPGLSDASAGTPPAQEAYYGQSVATIPGGTPRVLKASHRAQMIALLQLTQWGAPSKRETVPLMAPGSLMTTFHYQDDRRLEIITTTQTSLRPGLRLRLAQGLIEGDAWGRTINMRTTLK